jgi:hypothetical protein
MQTMNLSNKRKGLTVFLLTCLVMNFSLHAQETEVQTILLRELFLDLNNDVAGGLCSDVQSKKQHALDFILLPEWMRKNASRLLA